MPPPHPLSCRSSPLAGSVLFARELDVLRKATLKGLICTKDRVVAGTLLALSLPLCVTWAKSVVIFTSRIREKTGWCLLAQRVDNCVQFRLDSTRLQREVAKLLQAGDPPPKVPTNADWGVCCPQGHSRGGSAQECRAVVLCGPRNTPERKLSASSLLHQWQVQPSPLGLDFRVGLKDHEPEDNINARLSRFPLEVPGKSAEDV